MFSVAVVHGKCENYNFTVTLDLIHASKRNNAPAPLQQVFQNLNVVLLGATY